MKKMICAAGFLLMLGAVTSCESFLDETPKSKLTPENSFKTEDDWDNTLTAAYGGVAEHHRRIRGEICHYAG